MRSVRGVEDETRRCSFLSFFLAYCNLTTRVSFKVCSAIFFLLTHPPLHLEQRFKCANERGAVVRVMRYVFNNFVKVCACVCVGFCFAYLYSDKTEKGMCRQDRKGNVLFGVRFVIPSVNSILMQRVHVYGVLQARHGFNGFARRRRQQLARIVSS